MAVGERQYQADNNTTYHRYSRLQSKILVSECYLFILLEWSDDVTGYCAHVRPHCCQLRSIGSATPLHQILARTNKAECPLLLIDPKNRPLPYYSHFCGHFVYSTITTNSTEPVMSHTFFAARCHRAAWMESGISKKIINVLIYNK